MTIGMRYSGIKKEARTKDAAPCVHRPWSAVILLLEVVAISDVLNDSTYYNYVLCEWQTNDLAMQILANDERYIRRRHVYFVPIIPPPFLYILVVLLLLL
jgi:hypothetical protein